MEFLEAVPPPTNSICPITIKNQLTNNCSISINYEIYRQFRWSGLADLQRSDKMRPGNHSGHGKEALMAENLVEANKLEARLISNPFNAWMGLHLVSLDEDGLTIGLKWREEMISNPNARVTHGGILRALIDVAADFAIAAKVGMPVPTVDLRVDYHRAAQPGDLTAIGRVVRLGGTNSVAEAQVFGAESKLIASGRGVYFTAAVKM